jgi:hypothetical protein
VQGFKLTDTATCATGVVLGGGGVINLNSPIVDGQPALTKSYPSASNAWTAEAVQEVTSQSGANWSLTAHAVCSA